jgi:hypothetical protein
MAAHSPGRPLRHGEGGGAKNAVAGDGGGGAWLGFLGARVGSSGVREIFAIKSVRNRREGERKGPKFLAFPFRFGLRDSENAGPSCSGTGEVGPA